MSVRVDANKVRVWIDSKQTPESICAELNCTMEEFLDAFEKNYKRNPKEGAARMRDLKKNRKGGPRQRNHSNLGLLQKSDAEGDNQKELLADPTFVLETLTPTLTPHLPELVIEPAAPEVSESISTPQPPTPIAELEEEEAALVVSIERLESDRQETIVQGRQHAKLLREINLQLESLGEEINALIGQASEIREQEEENQEKRKAINDRKKEKTTRLEEIRRSIEALRTIVLYVYNDGRIEAPDNPDFVLYDEGYQELKAELGEKEECIDLRVRDVITLARLLKIVEHAGNRTVDIIFDRPELETAYEVLR